MGIIIENYAGRFPLWLSTEQVLVIPVSEKYVAYAKGVTEAIRDVGLRANADLKDDRIGYKIRKASMQKIPYVIVVGEKEQEAESINVRSRDDGELGEMKLAEFLSRIETERQPKKVVPAA